MITALLVGFPCAPGHIVHVNQWVDGQKEISTGDADEIHQTIDNQDCKKEKETKAKMSHDMKQPQTKNVK